MYYYINPPGKPIISSSTVHSYIHQLMLAAKRISKTNAADHICLECRIRVLLRISTLLKAHMYPRKIMFGRLFSF